MENAVRYDLGKLREDMALRGWLARDLARAAGVSDTSVHRFLTGKTQTARLAARLAQAIGHPVRRYIARRAA